MSGKRFQEVKCTPTTRTCRDREERYMQMDCYPSTRLDCAVIEGSNSGASTFMKHMHQWLPGAQSEQCL
eukprot:5242521-Ditylum_brightwellii.AAC.1